MTLRSDQTSLFDRLANLNEKPNMNSDLQQLIKTQSSISAFQGREARRAGFFTKVAKDLYQNIETKSFWKINKDTNTVERVVATDENGITKE